MTDSPIPILFQDDRLVAVDKPAGMFVHPTRLGKADRYVVQEVRDRLGRYVYPVQRLDFATSGLMVFALDLEAARHLAGQFERREIRKAYLAIVRGFLPEEGRFDLPLRRMPNRDDQSASTSFRLLARVELPIPLPPWPTVRYSLVECLPHSGRRHQIRRHFSRHAHPVIGDTEHGDSRHNRVFREHLGWSGLLLRAMRLSFAHPTDGRAVELEVGLSSDWQALLPRIPWLWTVAGDPAGNGEAGLLKPDSWTSKGPAPERPAPPG